MNNYSSGSPHRQPFPTRKVILISLIVAIIGLLALLLEFFPCQLMEWLRHLNPHFLLLSGILYLFSITLFLWPIWWSIDSENLNSPQNPHSIIKISLYWSVLLFFPWLLGLGLIGTFLPKTYTWLRAGVALLGLNYSFWKEIKPGEREAALIPWGISLVICLAILLSETAYTTPENFHSKLPKFEAVVALVDSGELKPNSQGFAFLPCRYSYLSNSGYKFRRGSIKITQEGETTIIRFWLRTYGMDGTDELIYRSDNKNISRPYDSIGIGTLKLKDHWFFETTYR